MKMLKAKYFLEIGIKFYGTIIGQMIKKLIALKENPGRVMIYGYKNSTSVGEIVVHKAHIKLELEIRSFNIEILEEVNRILTYRNVILEAFKNNKKVGLNIKFFFLDYE